MFFRAFPLKFLILLGMAFGAVSCVDHTYDFDRLDRSIAVGGEDFVLPLAHTGQMAVGDLLGDRLNNYLAQDADGTYYFRYASDPFAFAFDGLKDYDGTGPFRRYINYPINYSYSFFSKPEKTPDFDAAGEADLSGLIPAKVHLRDLSKSAMLSVPRLPDELVELQSITLSDDSRFDLTLSIPDCMLTDGTVTPDLDIDLSEFFESPDAEDGIFHFDTPLTPENGYSVTRSFHLHKVIFDPKNYDPKTHTLMLKAGVRFSGSCTISDPRTDRSHFKKAPATTHLKVSVILVKVDCQVIKGVFDYKPDGIQTTLDFKELMTGLSERLGSSNLSFENADPEILLDVSSNVTVPTRANINLVARKNRIRYADIGNILVDFPYAAPGETVNQRIRIAGDEKVEPGVQNVVVDFSKLMSRVPDEIQVSVSAATRTDMAAEIRVGETYFADILPQVRIPLVFGADTQMELRDTIALPQGMGELPRDNTFILAGQMTNTLPLQIDMTVDIINESGISLIEPVTQRIEAESTSAIKVPLKNLVKENIVYASHAVLTFQVNGTSTTRVLKADDYIQTDLHLQMPSGYHFSF